MPGSGSYEGPQHRKERAQSLAKFFAAGACLSMVAILVPGWEEMDRFGIALTVVAAASSSLLLTVFGARTPAWACHAATASGTALIAVCQVLAGSGAATASYALLYVWVALYASLYFDRRAVAGHIALTALLHAMALAWTGQASSLLPPLALTLGSQTAACLVVGSLTTRLRGLANTDPLTGLYNRRILASAIDQSLAAARRSGEPVCLVALDLDGFKALNDREGHAAGDDMLVATAQAWQACLRPTDTLARTGGDEFQVLLPKCELEEAEAVIARLLASTPLDVTCSAGLARWDGEETPEQLRSRADTAMYSAKAHCRGAFAVAEPAAPEPV